MRVSEVRPSRVKSAAAKTVKMTQSGIAANFFLGMSELDQSRGISGVLTQDERDFWYGLLAGTVQSPTMSREEAETWKRREMVPTAVITRFLTLFEASVADVTVFPIEMFSYLSPDGVDKTRRRGLKLLGRIGEASLKKRYFVTILCHEKHYYFAVFDHMTMICYWGDGLNMLDAPEPLLQFTVGLQWKRAEALRHASVAAYTLRKIRVPHQEGLTCAPIACACLLALFLHPNEQFPEVITDFTGRRGWDLHQLILLCIAKNTLQIKIQSHCVVPDGVFDEEPQPVVGQASEDIFVPNFPVDLAPYVPHVELTPFLLNAAPIEPVPFSLPDSIPPTLADTPDYPPIRKAVDCVVLHDNIQVLTLQETILIVLAQNKDGLTKPVLTQRVCEFQLWNIVNFQYAFDCALDSFKTAHNGHTLRIPKDQRMIQKLNKKWFINERGLGYLQERKYCSWKRLVKKPGRHRAKAGQRKQTLCLTAPPVVRDKYWIDLVKPIVESCLRPLALREIVAALEATKDPVLPGRSMLASLVRQAIITGSIEKQKRRAVFYHFKAPPETKGGASKGGIMANVVEYQIFKDLLPQNATEHVTWKMLRAVGYESIGPAHYHLYVSLANQRAIFYGLEGGVACREILYAGTLLELPDDHNTWILAHAPVSDQPSVEIRDLYGVCYGLVTRTCPARESLSVQFIA